MTATPLAKGLLLAVLAGCTLFALRLVAGLAVVVLPVNEGVIPWEWIPSWWIGWSAVGGAGWLWTRDVLFERRIAASGLGGPLFVASVLWGVFVGMAWFSFLAINAAFPAITPVSLSLSFRPLYREFNLVSTGVVALLSGSFAWGVLRLVARAKPPATDANACETADRPPLRIVKS
ncbi:MAG: hypothetical protein HYZ53_17680 [Planctomycetes bacterium]|nr:hypothetical protein [Planctomycetota bacterium]